MSFTTKTADGREVEIVSIDFDKPNYYQWGRNCANLSYTEAAAQRSLNIYSESVEISAEDCDEFWLGYHAVTEENQNGK